MVELEEVVHKLNAELDIEAFGIDSALKRFIPDVYILKPSCFHNKNGGFINDECITMKVKG
jgi:hypothetical protein